MENTLTYRLIKNDTQYQEYCDKLEALVFGSKKEDQDEIELLTLLIENYEEDHYKEAHHEEMDMDPIELLESLMEDHGLKEEDLTEILDLTKGSVSRILNYQKGLSMRSINRLADHFKLREDAFNRPYSLK